MSPTPSQKDAQDGSPPIRVELDPILYSAYPTLFNGFLPSLAAVLHSSRQLETEVGNSRGLQAELKTLRAERQKEKSESLEVKTVLDGREEQLKEREDQLDGREEQLKEREGQSDGREERLQEREGQLEGREERLKRDREELEEEQTDFEQRCRAILEGVGGRSKRQRMSEQGASGGA